MVFNCDILSVIIDKGDIQCIFPLILTNSFIYNLVKKIVNTDKSVLHCKKQIIESYMHNNDKMKNSAKYRYKDLIDFFIERGVSAWDYGVYGAIEGRHKDLVELFIEKGATTNDSVWNLGMKDAAFGGYEHLVDFFIEKSADDFNYGMHGAARGGYEHLVKFFIEKGAGTNNSVLDTCMYYAIKNCNTSLIDFFKKNIDENKSMLNKDISKI